MEDAHTQVLSLEEDVDKKERHSFFAVYDGHGGSNVAHFAGANTHKLLASSPDFKARSYEPALKAAFLDTDTAIRADPAFARDPSGCTATSVLITPDLSLYCANAGDSRSVLSVGGEATAISNDHKPTNEEESDRITRAGGFVQFGRVNGNLALSRAIGDFDFKKNNRLGPEEQIVTADPEIIFHSVTAEDEFVVLACDGIWDVLTSQQVVDYVRRRVAEGDALPQIAESLLDICLAPDSGWDGIGCDNMTVLIVAIKGDRTTEQWYAWIKDRVENAVGYPTPQEISSPYDFPPPQPDVSLSNPGFLPLSWAEREDPDYGQPGQGQQSRFFTDASQEEPSESSFLALQKLAMHLAKRSSSLDEGEEDDNDEEDEEVESKNRIVSIDTDVPQSNATDSDKGPGKKGDETEKKTTSEPQIVTSPASVSP